MSRTLAGSHRATISGADAFAVGRRPFQDAGNERQGRRVDRAKSKALVRDGDILGLSARVVWRLFPLRAMYRALSRRRSRKDWGKRPLQPSGRFHSCGLRLIALAALFVYPGEYFLADPARGRLRMAAA